MATDLSQKTVGDRLSHIRSGRTQVEAANLYGVHKNTYARWERDEREPTASDLVKFIALGWNANWLLTGEGPERLEALSDAVSEPSQALRPDTLKMAITLAQEALDGKTLSSEDYSALIILIYDALANGLKSAQVLAFAKPAARGLGAVDGREAVGGAGKEAPGKG